MTTAVMTGRVASPSVAAARYWWLYLLEGIGWLLFAVIIFRFDYVTVSAISILFGVGAIVAGGLEFAATTAEESGWWKLAHALLGMVLIVGGIVAFINPGGTFVALAAVVSIVLVVMGAFDITTAFMTKGTNSSWWLQLITGIAAVLLGFWAAGSWDISAILLVAWVAAFALMRGITAISLSIRLFEMRHATA